MPAQMAGDARGGDLVMDGIVGYSLSGAPRGAAADLIRWANAQRTPVLALDVLSGLDGTTREAYVPFPGDGDDDACPAKTGLV